MALFNRVRLLAFLCLSLAGLTHHSAIGAQTTPAASRQSEITAITTNRVVAPQVRQTITFEKQAVFFSTDFDGARLAEVRETGPRSFQVMVEAENYPVNSSPWYAFQIWSTTNQSVRLELSYTRTGHRYHPRISRDRATWAPVADEKLHVSESKRAATISLDIGPEPLYVAAQELFTSSDYQKWIRELAALPFVSTRVLGKSTLGRPIHLLEITENDGPADRVLIIGRQHPPEVTGALALREFVTALCGDSDLAKSFRRHFKATIVPLVNPDGVDAGHWRHNTMGADLNRDWGQFNQAETRLVRDAIAELIADKESRILLAFDFHSTRSDVFYVSHPSRESPAQDPGAGEPPRGSFNEQRDLTWEWLRDLGRRIPDYPVPSTHSFQRLSGRTLSFSPWISRTAGIGAITHETGDNTDRDTIRRLSEGGAESLMSTMLKELPQKTLAGDGNPANGRQSTSSQKILRVALYKGEGTGGKGPPNIMNYFADKPAARVTEVEPAEIRAGILRQYDVVIFAGGSASKQAETIGEEGRKEVRNFIENGGGYIGICAGAYLAASGFSWGLELLDARTVSPKWRRGVGDVKMELTEAGRRILGDLRGEQDVWYANGPILEPAELPEIEDYEVLAWFRTELADNDTPPGIMVGSPAILSGALGKGRVVCFSPHPEQTKGLEGLVESAISWVGGREDARVILSIAE
jgi:cytosolic carboxypeptidase protein 6